MTGAAFCLRPVTLDDARAIVELRRESERTQYLHPVASDPQLQREWLERYFERAGDWYFAIVRKASGDVEGFVGICDVRLDAGRRIGEWGRWILRGGSLGATESALLVYRAAFNELGLDLVYCRTVADNAPVVAFHDRCSPSARSVLPDHVELRGQRYDMIEHRFERTQLAAIEAVLAPMSTRIARRLAEQS